MSRETHPVATSRSSLVGGWLTAVVFFGLAGTVWLATRSSGTLLDLFEQGHRLGPASDMLAGKVPYRETFPMHGFLSDGGRDYLLFRLFEPTYRLSTDAESGGWLDAIDGIPNSRRVPRVWSRVLENYPVRVKVGDTLVALPEGASPGTAGSSRPVITPGSSPPSSAPRPAGRSRG